MTPAVAPPTPLQSQQLRLQTLGALLGASPAGAGASRGSQSVLDRLAALQASLDHVVGQNAVLANFAARYDAHRPWLLPDLAAGDAEASTGAVGDATAEGRASSEPQPSLVAALSQREMATLLLEAEPELRDLERQLSLLQNLSKACDADDLEGVPAHAPTISSLREHEQAAEPGRAQRQDQVLSLLADYADSVQAISELFVQWDDKLTQLELAVSRAERARAPPSK